MARKKVVAGNWKMHKTWIDAAVFVKDLWTALGADPGDCEIIVGPPFPAIGAAANAAVGTSIRVAGQNMHWEETGAYTGEVSGLMLKAAGCSHVIIGHSERRQLFGETDETVRWKIGAALQCGLIPIFCVGETLEEREAEKTFEVVGSQLTLGLEGIEPGKPDDFVVAYEPVWAIGTGKTATPDQAQEVHAFVRSKIGARLGSEFADSVRILYGGSVKPSNTRELMSRSDIDGGLVGGASLKPEDFLGIIREAL